MCSHEWLLVPGGDDARGVFVAGYWVCVHCKLRGPSSLAPRSLWPSPQVKV